MWKINVNLSPYHQVFLVLPGRRPVPKCLCTPFKMRRQAGGKNDQGEKIRSRFSFNKSQFEHFSMLESDKDKDRHNSCITNRWQMPASNPVVPSVTIWCGNSWPHTSHIWYPTILPNPTLTRSIFRLPLLKFPECTDYYELNSFTRNIKTEQVCLTLPRQKDEGDKYIWI